MENEGPVNKLAEQSDLEECSMLHIKKQKITDIFRVFAGNKRVDVVAFAQDKKENYVA